jgi:hypothetical protein
MVWCTCRENGRNSPVPVVVAGLGNSEYADQTVKVGSNIGEFSAAHDDAATMSGPVCDNAPIQIVRPRAIAKMDPLAAICFVCRMGRVHRHERRRIASEMARGGHRWYPVLHHHAEREACDLSAFSLVVGRAQRPSSRSKDYDRSRVNQSCESSTPDHGSGASVQLTKLTQYESSVSPFCSSQTKLAHIGSGKKRMREDYELNSSPIKVRYLRYWRFVHRKDFLEDWPDQTESGSIQASGGESAALVRACLFMIGCTLLSYFARAYPDAER